MTGITVNSDANWSELGATIDDRVVVNSGAILTVDTLAEVEVLQIGDAETEGTLRLDPSVEIDYENPLITFKDSEEAGIIFYRGSFGIDLQNPLENRYVLRTELKEKNRFPGNRWSFIIDGNSDLKEDIFLMQPEFLEMLFVDERLYYDENGSTECYEFEDGFLGVEDGEDLQLHKNSIDGGSASWNDYSHTEGREWEIEGELERFRGGKRKLDVLHHISNSKQRDTPVLMVSYDIFSFANIRTVHMEIKDVSTYSYKLKLLEVKTEYEKFR